VENAQFRNLLTLFREDYTDEDMPHRSKIRVAILDTWRNWFGQLKMELKVSMITDWTFCTALLSLALQNAVGALHFTADMWSDRRRRSYICITVHWIAFQRPAERAGLEFKSSLLAFQALPGRHTGKRIAKAVYRLLNRAGVNGGNVSIVFNICSFSIISTVSGFLLDIGYGSKQ
jgi:hypothetical protein